MAKYDLREKAFNVDNARFAIVAARFNDKVVNPLLEGAIDALKRHGVDDERVTVLRVPGAFEIPLTARRLATTGRYDAIIALGAVIRGGTPHFDYVAGECARGVSQVSLEQDMPVIFGVLTTDNEAQAMDRAGGREGNKGEEAALAALEMVSLLRTVDR